MKQLVSAAFIAAILSGLYCIAAQAQPPSELAFANMPAEVKQEIERLYSADDGERRDAADRLAKLGPAAGPAIPYLVKLIGGRRLPERTREAFIGALAKTGKPAVKPLAEMARSKDASLRRQVVAGLAMVGDPAAREPLARVATGDAESDIRRLAIESLKRSGAGDMVERWTKAMQDEKLAPPARARAIQALGIWGEKEAVAAVVELLKANQKKELDQRIFAAGAEVLARHADPQSTPLFLAALKDWRPAVRAWAIWALNDVKDSRTVEPLVAALKDSDDRVRIRAADALGLSQDARAVPALIGALADPNAEVRLWAAAGLGQLGDGAAVEPLTAALGDAEARVRLSAAAALAALEDPRGVPPLLAVLRNPNSDKALRIEAIRALGTLGDVRSAELLSMAMRDSDAVVRGQAVAALGRLGDPRAVRALSAALGDSDVAVRGIAAMALGRLGSSDAVAPLVAASKDSEPRVRRNVAIALGMLGDTQAVEGLKGLSGDSDASVKAAAAEALKRLATR